MLIGVAVRFRDSAFTNSHPPGNSTWRCVCAPVSAGMVVRKANAFPGGAHSVLCMLVQSDVEIATLEVVNAGGGRGIRYSPPSHFMIASFTGPPVPFCASMNVV